MQRGLLILLCIIPYHGPSMNKRTFPFFHSIIFSMLLFLSACGDVKPPPEKVIVTTPEQLEKKASDIIQQALAFAASNEGNIGDSTILLNTSLLQQVYEANGFNPIWSEKERWLSIADSQMKFIADARLYGLFPEDYYYGKLDSISRRFIADSLAKSDKRDAVLWSKADLMLTDAFVHIVKDIKLGRLPNDSVTLRRDSLLSDTFYFSRLDSLRHGGSLRQMLDSLEPQQEGYRLLKAAIPQFLDSADYRDFTIVPAPGRNQPADFTLLLQRRLYEGGYIDFDSVPADSMQLANAVKRFQKQKNITVDGKAGEGTVRMLNLSDREKFIRIAISMDRYKLLPEKMPERYIWVNLPSFYMKLRDGDSVMLVSKIICGKTLTRTPLLTSAISEIITYPQWTIPNSIIVKEILPALKRSPEYLAKKGFSLLDKNGDEVDPYTVEWSKYSKGIPYKVVQGSGDANALGILKFNFPNKYAVYLHDTNQRSLFGLTVRNLSHGCVRVQEWQKLADYIIRNDRRSKELVDTFPMLDSMNTWLGRKEKHSIPVRNRLPVFIRYFTCEARLGGIVFYDDIYGEDKKLKELYFANK
jgi:L,D-transpeptidase YcbB